jgi:transcription elongation GreA/GreB family factor
MVWICASCGGAFAVPLDICHACAALLSTTTARAGRRRQQPGGTAARPVLRARDAVALQRLLHSSQHSGEALFDALRAKLDDSCIMPPEAVSAETASLGSRIVFSASGGTAQARVLVLPRDHSPAGWTLPVTTPRGLALLGHAAGAVVTAEGSRAEETLRLLAVAGQRDTGSSSASRPRGRAGRPGH